MYAEEQTSQIRDGKGFVAALDQSGGSTPKALGLYGVSEDQFRSEEEMYDLIHAMRSRIVHAPDFTGDKVVGAILFEKTMDRTIDGQPAAEYIWEKRKVVPFLKVDQGLQDASNGVKLMKPIEGLDALLERATEKRIFGTKMRSVIDAATKKGISDIVDQQFAVGATILEHGLVPILEPEITISISDKAEAEQILRSELLARLDALSGTQNVMLKLTLPEEPNTYQALVDHPRVLRVVALSGGYSRAEANRRLAKNNGVIASFSRALTEGLSASQSDAEFNAQLGSTIKEIYEASISGQR